MKYSCKGENRGLGGQGSQAGLHGPMPPQGRQGMVPSWRAGNQAAVGVPEMLPGRLGMPVFTIPVSQRHLLTLCAQRCFLKVFLLFALLSPPA